MKHPKERYADMEEKLSIRHPISINQAITLYIEEKRRFTAILNNSEKEKVEKAVEEYDDNDEEDGFWIECCSICFEPSGYCQGHSLEELKQKCEICQEPFEWCYGHTNYDIDLHTAKEWLTKILSRRKTTECL